MKKTSYILYALWVIVAVLSKILLGASLWFALSWLWLPAAIALVIGFGLTLSIDIGKWLRVRERKKDPDTCENCLFGLTAEYDPEKKCLGEKLNAENHRPTLCKFYKRQR